MNLGTLRIEPERDRALFLSGERTARAVLSCVCVSATVDDLPELAPLDPANPAHLLELARTFDARAVALEPRAGEPGRFDVEG